MASNSEDQAEMVVDLMSPLSSVDDSSKDRNAVQEELERRLKCRAHRDILVKKHILPDLTTSPKLFTQTQQLQRAKIADNLQKKLRNRADKTDLKQMNILPDLQPNIDPALQATQLQLRKSKLADHLNEKLAKRPGPLELIQEHILEPRNEELAAVLGSVDFEKTSDASLKLQRSSIPEISLQGADAALARTVALTHQHSVPETAPTRPHPTHTTPSKEIASPLSDTSATIRKLSDSSLSPYSPGEGEDSPGKSPQNLTSPKFTSSYPPCVSHPPRMTQTQGILSGIGKAPSPSQTRKKQAKQQKYRKLRYHEYVPPTRPNAKPGKTTPKPSSKSDTPYSLLLQQQQLFLQLQVLQQQYPNGVLMQKLPDLLNTLSSKKGKSKSRNSATSPLSTDRAKQVTAMVPTIPQVLQVEQPNRFNMTTVRFDELKVSDLKGACKELGMIVSGKKAELVERLLEHNNGVLPVIALPDTQNKDARRQAFSTSSHSIDSQVSVTSTVSPASPSLSPVFQFPSDHYSSHYPHHYHHHHPQQQQQQMLWNTGVPPPPPPPPSTKPDTLSNISALGNPQVFPASNFQAHFNELYERQKRNYISQKAPKPLAPRPELNDMVAIKFSKACPTDQSQRINKGSTLPHCSEGKSNFLQMEKQSRSLPSSPRPVSPSDSFPSELMDDTPALEKSTSIDTAFTPISSAASLTGPIPESESLYHIPNSVPLNVAVSSAALAVSTTANMAPPAYQPSMRPGRSSVPVQPKTHPMNPPSYGSSLMQRSISLSGPPPLPHTLGLTHRMQSHSGASFNSDMSDLMTSPEVGAALTPENMLGLPGEDLSDIPMETEYKDRQLSDIFDILTAEGSDVNPPAQYHSLSSTHYTNPPKLGAIRQESTQSDSVMLMPFSNPSLALHQNKSGSDLNIPGRESQKNSGTYVGMAGHGNLLNSTNELGWLDLDNSSLLNLSPTLNTFGGLSHHSSNPGSLPHEQFHLSFMEDGVHTKCSNISTNGLSSHGVHEASSYMDHGISQQAGLFPPTDDAALIVELGLSTS